MSGYLHSDYAKSLEEFGKPFSLPQSGGYVLERNIPASPGYRDAMGCYPLFCCQDWSALPHDLKNAGSRWVSLALVPDPFGNYTLDLLRSCFPDHLIQFKHHYITDLYLSPSQVVSKHHRYYALRVLDQLHVNVASHPIKHLDDWVALYQVLIERHQLSGIKAFSKSAFARQLSLPGTVLLLAQEGHETIAAHIWYVQGPVAYSHLAASNERGYELMAAYGLYWKAIEYFADCGLRWLDLGGGAGIEVDAEDGLSRFKRGWSTSRRPIFFCGRIFTPARYTTLADSTGNADSAYFPAYRTGELA